MRKCCQTVNFEISSLLVTTGNARFLWENAMGFNLSFLNHFSIAITKSWSNLETDRISKPSIIANFWKFSKIGLPPTQIVDQTLTHPKRLISRLMLRYLIGNYFSDTICLNFFHFDVTHKFANLHQPQYSDMWKICLKNSDISDFQLV